VNQIKLIGIILVLAITPFVVNEAFGLLFGYELIPEAFADTTSFIVGTVKQFQTDASISSTCSTGTGTSSAVPKVVYGASGNNVFCKGLTFQFDVSSIPNSTVVTGMTLRIDVLGGSNQKNSQIFQVLKDPSLMTDQEGTDTVFQRAGGFNGTIYISNNTFSLTSGLDKLIVLPNTAHADLRNQLLQGESEFWLAINYEDLVNRGVGDSEVTYGGVELQVEFDTTPPVISTSVPQPVPIQENSVYDEFEFVSCIDDIDGDITMSMSTVGTVDTANAQSYVVEYSCTDSATNSASSDIIYIIKRENSGGSLFADTTVSSIPAPLFTPSEEPVTEVGRALSLFDQLNSFFDFTTTPEPTPDVPTGSPVAPETTTEPDQRESFVDTIRDFLSGLFG